MQKFQPVWFRQVLPGGLMKLRWGSDSQSHREGLKLLLSLCLCSVSDLELLLGACGRHVPLMPVKVSWGKKKQHCSVLCVCQCMSGGDEWQLCVCLGGTLAWRQSFRRRHQRTQSWERKAERRSVHSVSLSYSPSALRATTKTWFIKESTLWGFKDVNHSLTE